MSARLWFTSDTHFGHESCVRWEGGKGQLPASIDTAAKRDRYIIKRWNATVGESDQVWHLGDFAFRTKTPVAEYLDQLNGRIHFVRGNHDDKIAWKNRELFESAHDAHYLKHYGVRIYLHHYPCEVWRSSQNGTFHLHGHAHGDLSDKGRRMDVGIMCHDYKPVAFGDIVERLAFGENSYHHPKGAT